MRSAIVEACLLGGALGDSLGLPSEGLNARRIAKMRPLPLRQGLIAGRGMVSDDTEHALMTYLSLREAQGDVERFTRRLAGRLKWWLAALPAGVGLATARSIIKLSIGVKATQSGVFSAGNGPLMRAPILGVCLAEDEERRRQFVEASTRLTHRDPRALECAQLVATAATAATAAAEAIRVGSNLAVREILDRLQAEIESPDLIERFRYLRDSLERGDSVSDLADRIGRKRGFVSGFAPDSAAVAIYAWLRHLGDFRGVVTSVVFAGGDIDTTGFIAGSIAAVESGSELLPMDWLRSLRDWPLNAERLRGVAAGDALCYPFWPTMLPRNLWFLAIVLGHGFRRMLPPYVV